MTNTDQELFEADYPDFATKLKALEAENAQLKTAGNAPEAQSADWTPPTYDEVARQTEEAFAAHRKGEIAEGELHERVRGIQALSERPTVNQEPVSDTRSREEIQRETDDIFATATSETELMQRLTEAGAASTPGKHTR
jgi:hypothetical protein